MRSRLQAVEYKWLVAVIFVVGLFMDLLDTTVVNVALPTLGTEFDVAENTTLQWVVTAYLLSLAVWIPASGWLGDRFGTKRLFIIALILFTGGSALCGEAWNIESLIFFRVLQGIGGGMLTPVGTAMLFRAFPPRERAAAAAVLAIPVAIAPTIGPIVGGLLVDHASWRWIFRVNVPIGIIGVILAVVFLKEHTEPSVDRFDLPGFLLAGAGLPLVLYALSEAPSSGWGSQRVLLTGLGGLVLLAALIVVELRAPQPMLALRLFRDRMFRSANIVFFISSAGLLGLLFLLPLFLQQLRGLSATESGFATFPQALGLVVVARFVSRLYPRIGPRRMLFLGMLGTALSTLPFLWVDLETSLWSIRAIMFVRGISFAFSIIPLQTATFATVSPQDSGRASALFSTNRQIGASFGVAILATVLAERIASHAAAVGSGGAEASVDGYHDAFLVAMILALIGMAFTLLVHDEDAAATMVAVHGRGHGAKGEARSVSEQEAVAAD